MIITRQKPRLGELPDWTLFPQPVGLWLFNEGAGGIVADLSGNGNTGSLVADTHFVPGPFGPVLDFDGTGDFVNLNTVDFPGTSLFCDSSQKFTVAIWIKIPVTKQGTIIARAGGVVEERTLQIFVSGVDALAVTIRGGQNDVSSGTQIADDPNDGLWHLVVVTWDGVTALGYYDGIYTTTLIVGVAAEETSENVIIGARTGGTGYFLTGAVDIPMIFNRALSASEIAELYVNPFPWFQRDPIELWSAAQVAVGDDYVRTIDDDMGIGDVRTDAKTFSRILTENLGVADASDRSATYPRTLAATLGLVDDLIKEETKVIADSLGLSDTFSKSISYVRREAETLGISDSIIPLSVFLRAFTETIDITDTTSKVEAFSRILAEALGIEDSMTRSQIQARVITDDIGLLDLMQKGEIITFAENMGITDSMLRLVAYISNPRDSVGITDDMVRVALALRTVSDDVGMLDEQTIEHATDLVKAVWAFMLIKKH